MSGYEPGKVISESMKEEVGYVNSVLEEEGKIREILLNSMNKLTDYIKHSQETFKNMNIYITSDNELCGEYKDSGTEMSITFKHASLK